MGAPIETINVLPVNDLKPHIESPACKCQPSVEAVENGGRVIVHNAWDGREFHEQEGFTKATKDA